MHQSNLSEEQEDFHWPQLRAVIEEFIAACPICQRAKSEHCHYPGLLAPLSILDLA
jgi:hypothetical protein